MFGVGCPRPCFSGICCPILTESAPCVPLPHSSPLPIPAPSLTSARPVQLLLPSWSHRALDFPRPALPCVLLHRGAPYPSPGPIPGTSSPGIWLPQPGSVATSLSPGCGRGGFSAARRLLWPSRGEGWMLVGIFPYRGKSGFRSLQSLPHHAWEALPALGKKQLHSPVSC